MRSTFRYVPYSVAQDQTAATEYEVVCVSGDEADCGKGSGRHDHPEAAEEWMRKHTQETRHFRYRRTFADYAVWEPRDRLLAELEPAVISGAPST